MNQHPWATAGGKGELELETPMMEVVQVTFFSVRVRTQGSVLSQGDVYFSNVLVKSIVFCMKSSLLFIFPILFFIFYFSHHLGYNVSIVDHSLRCIHRSLRWIHCSMYDGYISLCTIVYDISIVYVCMVTSHCIINRCDFKSIASLRSPKRRIALA